MSDPSQPINDEPIFAQGTASDRNTASGRNTGGGASPGEVTFEGRMDAPNRQAYRAAQSFLYDRLNYERLASGTARYPFRLQRTAELLDRLGLIKFVHRPDSIATTPLIHIAGTKGKGSTAAMVSAILTASGLKTGSYTSPHLNRIEERFRVNGTPCGENEFIDLVQSIQPVVDKLALQENHPSSFFEITTAMALMHFDRTDCDAIVLETGLGGRLDSTNVCASTVTAITTIGLDHQHVLGNTLGEIAGEKAGIAKPNIPLICGVTADEPRIVIENQAASVGATVFQKGIDFDSVVEPAEHWGTEVTYRGNTSPLFPAVNATLPLEGLHQGHNAAMAISIAALVAQQISDSHQVTVESVANGLSRTNSEARVERFHFSSRTEISSETEIIIDSAHNVDSIEALCRCVEFRSGSRPVTIVFGTSRDKDAQAMIERLAIVAGTIIFTRFLGNPRFTPPEHLKELTPNGFEGRCIVEETPESALRMATNTTNTAQPLVVVCGSFFLAGETRQWVMKQLAASQNGIPSSQSGARH